jgi:DUF971 family protein
VRATVADSSEHQEAGNPPPRFPYVGCYDPAVPASSDTPARLDLQKDAGLRLTYADGSGGFLGIGRLRSMCPCAGCRENREQQAAKPTRLQVLGEATDVPLSVVRAELVGNYALKVTWSDGHAAGIYSFAYLRSLLSRA